MPTCALNHMGKDRKERPMSRFWSCFFAGSIFALYWTLPMKKSIKWALQFVGLWLVSIGAGLAVETVIMVENYGAAMGIWAISLGPLAVIIIVMYRWVSAYNLEHFGYASKSEWDKARREELE